MPADMVLARGVHKYYGAFHALHGVDLTVAAGEVVCIIGPSGSGKSTLLRCLNQLERIESGSIRIAGELAGYARKGDMLRELSDAEIARQRLASGMVFQRFNLFGHQTALQNIMEGPVTVQRRPRAEVREEAMALLARVGLADKHGSYPSELSGGQQQRVAIARALAMRPDVILFDEPTSALDPELVGEVLNTIRQLAQEKRTMVIVTHEMSFARDVADRAIFMDQGRIVEQGPAKSLFANPQQPRTRQFLEKFLMQ